MGGAFTWCKPAQLPGLLGGLFLAEQNMGNPSFKKKKKAFEKNGVNETLIKPTVCGVLCSAEWGSTAHLPCSEPWAGALPSLPRTGGPGWGWGCSLALMGAVPGFGGGSSLALMGVSWLGWGAWRPVAHPVRSPGCSGSRGPSAVGRGSNKAQHCYRT